MKLMLCEWSSRSGLIFLKTLPPKKKTKAKDIKIISRCAAVVYLHNTFHWVSCSWNFNCIGCLLTVCSASSIGKSQKLLAAVNFWWPINYNVKSLTSTMILEKPNGSFKVYWGYSNYQFATLSASGTVRMMIWATTSGAPLSSSLSGQSSPRRWALWPADGGLATALSLSGVWGWTDLSSTPAQCINGCSVLHNHFCTAVMTLDGLWHVTVAPT